MSSPNYAAPLRLERRASPFLRNVLLLVHGTALLSLIVMPAAWWIKGGLALAVVGQGVVSWRRQLSFSAPAAPARLVWHRESGWVLIDRTGRSRRAHLLPGGYVHPWLVVLRFVTEDGRRCAVVLPRDGLDPDSHRRLRVQLTQLQGMAAPEA